MEIWETKKEGVKIKRRNILVFVPPFFYYWVFI
jgi:hypothetical protein